MQEKELKKKQLEQKIKDIENEITKLQEQHDKLTIALMRLKQGCDDYIPNDD